jgi:hypothetical protein
LTLLQVADYNPICDSREHEGEVKEMDITENSQRLFKAYAEDAENWNGQPLVGETKEERGNLTQLKRAGLATTFREEGCLWLDFTPEGIAYAKELGYSIHKV